MVRGVYGGKGSLVVRRGCGSEGSAVVRAIWW